MDKVKHPQLVGDAVTCCHGTHLGSAGSAPGLTGALRFPPHLSVFEQHIFAAAVVVYIIVYQCHEGHHGVHTVDE